ncbi:MAG: glutathione S-transferase family protein [Myxococcales bacterium]|nr:glutathione S-transferase family protein [Myxococcales bacterium]MCB9749774.1 glutathione S-transferase family protein [Myxococcales bacterium]
MKHYYHPMSRAVTTDWMLRELDAPHERCVVDYLAGDNAKPEYRAVNPMGKVPALVDGDTVVTETAAICAYLADKFIDKGLAPPLGSTARGQYYRYLFFSGTTLEPMFTVRHLGLTEYDARSVGWGDMPRCLATVESMTPARDWALGSQFTAADVVFGGTLDFAVQFGWLTDPSPKVAAYVQRIKARPAYRAAHDSSWH